MSVWQSPVATIRTRISSSRGPSRSTSSSEKSPPCWSTIATVVFINSAPNLWVAEVGVGPRADDSAGTMGLAALGEKVIGALERDEAAWVAGQSEDLARVLDADRVVGG